MHVLCRYWEQEVRKKQQGGKARLSLALLKCIWWRFLLIALLYVLEVCFVCVCVCSVYIHVRTYISVGVCMCEFVVCVFIFVYYA